LGEVAATRQFAGGGLPIVTDRCQLIKTSCPQIAPHGVTDCAMRRHRLKENFGAKIRVIRDALWHNLRAFLVSVFGFRQKVLLISVALRHLLIA
jgi:hypothetical protein